MVTGVLPELHDASVRSDVATDVAVPTPPFFGTRVVKGVPLADYAALLDERATFLGQWGLRGSRGGQGPTYEELVETQGRPRLRYWLDRLATEGVLSSAALVYGYFPAVAEGDSLVVLEEPRPDAAERTRFTFPRQRRDRHLCLADFVKSRESGQIDVLPVQLVTAGSKIEKFTSKMFAANQYRDYYELNGLVMQLTEALAEFWHARIRSELGFAAEEPKEKAGLFKLDYRGARFSLGYPACPDMEDRRKVTELLKPERMGVVLSDELMLHPEQSTDAFVFHHPEAKYFKV